MSEQIWTRSPTAKFWTPSQIFPESERRAVAKALVAGPLETSDTLVNTAGLKVHLQFDLKIFRSLHEMNVRKPNFTESGVQTKLRVFFVRFAHKWGFSREVLFYEHLLNNSQCLKLNNWAFKLFVLKQYRFQTWCDNQTKISDFKQL